METHVKLQNNVEKLLVAYTEPVVQVLCGTHDGGGESALWPQMSLLNVPKVSQSQFNLNLNFNNLFLIISYHLFFFQFGIFFSSTVNCS